MKESQAAPEEGPVTSREAQADARRKQRAKRRGTSRVLRQKTELELLSDISSKLDRLSAVFATQGKDRDVQVAILASAGCDSVFVGTFVGMSAGAVRKLPGWRHAQREKESTDAAQEES